MILQSILPSGSVPVVFDASVIINFLGTGIADQLVKNLGRAILMEQHAFKEVKRHPIPGRDAAAELQALVNTQNLAVVEMDEKSREIFYELTSDDLAGGLDDGEAATIALAVLEGSTAIPALDERKAINILQRKWPSKHTISTLDMLMDAETRQSIQPDVFADAIYTSLQFARMRVPLLHRDNVIRLIGLERAKTCACLGSIFD